MADNRGACRTGHQPGLATAEQPPPGFGVPVLVAAVTVFDTADTLPAASTARTWKRNVVLAASPLLVNDEPVDVPTCANVPPLAPGARRN